MAEWKRVELKGEPFLLREEEGVFFLHSMGNGDYRDEALRDQLAEELGLSRLFKVRQVHGVRIVEVGHGRSDEEGDGLLLSEGMEGVGIAVLTADCLPLLMIAPRHLLLLHVGWRGLAGGIVQRAIDILTRLYGDNKNFKTWLGPHIKQCCYEVGPDMVQELRRSLPESVVEAGLLEEEGRLRFSLASAVRKMLEINGFTGFPQDCGLCTYCSGSFPSYRRMGEAAPRMINLAWRAKVDNR